MVNDEPPTRSTTNTFTDLFNVDANIDQVVDEIANRIEEAMRQSRESQWDRMRREREEEVQAIYQGTASEPSPMPTNIGQYNMGSTSWTSYEHDIRSDWDGAFSVVNQEAIRIDRACNGRIYLLEAVLDKGTWTFKVEGTRHQPYDLVVGKNRATCTCPDFLRRQQKLCKHILFIVYRVAGMPQTETPTSELLSGDALFAKISARLDNVENSDVVYVIDDPDAVGRNAKERADHGRERDEKEENKSDETNEKDGECPVCMDSLSEGDLVTCPHCKNEIHLSCMKIWWKAKNKTCVLCRGNFYQKQEPLQSQEPSNMTRNLRTGFRGTRDDCLDRLRVNERRLAVASN